MATVRNIICAGDSTVQGTVGGYNLGNIASQSSGSWPERLATMANHSLGPLLGGGFRPLWLRAGQSSWSEWVSSGTWTSTVSTDTFDLAPFGYALYNSTAGTLQWQVPPNLSAAAGFAIYWIDTASVGNWQYSIDGGSFVNMNQTRGGNPPTLNKFYVPTACTSSVTIKAHDGTSNALAIIAGIEPYRLDPRSNDGVIIHNLGKDANFLAVFAGGFDGDRLAFLDKVVLGTNAVSNTPQDFYVMFTNDVAFGADPTGYQAIATSLFNRVAAAGCTRRTGVLPFEQYGKDLTGVNLTSGNSTITTTGLTSHDTGQAISGTGIAASTTISFVNSTTGSLSHPATATVSGGTAIIGRSPNTQSGYRAAMAAAAAATGSSVIDIYSLWSHTYGAGWTASNTAGLMNDDLHESGTGHREIASRIWWGS